MESKWFHHISPTKYIFPFFSKIIALHRNVVELSEYNDSADTEMQDVWMR